MFQTRNPFARGRAFDAPIVEHGVAFMAQVEEMVTRRGKNAAAPGKRCGARTGDVEELVAGGGVEYIDAFEGAVVTVDF